MPFTISPTEAQAIQEDEVQLLNAIAQLAQRVPGVFRTNSNGSEQQPTDSLRIKMGRRLVYGQLADGPFRHELDVNSLKVIADALQRPVTPGVNPEQYLRKVPAIEIFHGSVLLFREERDGTVTTNEIYFEVKRETRQQTENNQQAEQPTSSTEPAVESVAQSEPIDVEPIVEPPVELESPTVQPEVDDSVAIARANQLLTTAQYLLNPLRQGEAIYDEVSVQGYQIKKRDADIIISDGESDVLHARNGEIISSQITDLDWTMLGQIQVPERLPQPVLNDLPKPVINETAQVESTDSQQTDGSTAEPDLAAHPTNPIEDTTIEETERVITTETTEGHSALSVLERETQDLPVSLTKQLLQATIQDWKQQVGQRLSNRLQQGVNWLSNQQTVLQNQRLAYAVHQLFQRGYERTGEQSYHVRDCTIKRRGQNLYVLKDAVGELMKFKASKVMGFGRRMTVISVSDRLTHRQRQSLLDNQLDSSAMPQGSLDMEAAYANKTQKVEKTVRQFLTNFAHAHTWNRENGRFKLEIGEGDTLRVTDKQDGRGVVFERKNGEVSSKLGGQDFAHFERLFAKMQKMTARQNQTSSSQSQPTDKSEVTKNGFKKTSAVEMD